MPWYQYYDKLKSAAATFADPARVEVFAGDVADAGDVQRIVEAANQLQALTIAIANAGTGDIAPLVATDDDRWQQVLDTNLNGTYQHNLQTLSC